MSTLALMIRPIAYGWSVDSTDGRQLARFTGPGARRRAMCFIAGVGYDGSPSIVGRVHSGREPLSVRELVRGWISRL